jgi:phosphoserine phosphatase RsbU/P
MLEALLDPPHFFHETHDKEPPNTLEQRDMDCDLMLSLFAVTCYRQHVAEDITSALTAHYNLTAALAGNIHLCLHEAVLNGVIHGNLSVPGIFRDKKTLGYYYEWIETRLAIPSLSLSRIQVRSTLKNNLLVLEVVDEGRGYAHNRYIGTEDNLKPHQGLSLIRQSCNSVRILGTGNHIQMEFVIT